LLDSYSNTGSGKRFAAKDDLIRIYHFGAEKFGITQADKYFNSFF
jgi:plasmid stabilization system protein ParE